MPRSQPDQADALETLLARARSDSAEFPVLLANHLPMILVALHRLGASPERLAAYADAYRATNGLVPPPPARGPLGREDWTRILGQRDREGDARAFFTAEVRHLGLRETLARALPTLIPGVGASALHALMRLAYGVMRTDPDEVGAALGYWAATFLPLPPATGAAPMTADPADVLAAVANLPALRAVEPESDLLWHNIAAVGWAPDFAPIVDRLAIDAATPARLASVSLALYAATMDFAALHALTGMHWVRLVLPYCPDGAALQRHFWQVIAALVPKLGCPALPGPADLEAWRALPCPEWPAIAAKAIGSEDEHDISLVFSAREEERHTGDRLYRVVAARRVALIA